jgi:hypothetical protein
MPNKSKRSKLCFKCDESFKILFRAKSDTLKEWKFFCENCLLNFKEETEGYVYGGTWKRDKKKR